MRSVGVAGVGLALFGDHRDTRNDRLVVLGRLTVATIAEPPERPSHPIVSRRLYHQHPK